MGEGFPFHFRTGVSYSNMTRESIWALRIAGTSKIAFQIWIPNELTRRATERRRSAASSICCFTPTIFGTGYLEPDFQFEVIEEIQVSLKVLSDNGENINGYSNFASE